MQTLHRKHPEQRFGTGLCTRGNSKTIYNQNLGVEKLVKICAIWILTTVILMIVSWVFCSKFTNLSERQSTLLPKHKFMLDLVTLRISCSAGRCGNVFGACQESRSIYLGSPCINPSPSWASVSPLVGRKKKKESLAPPCSE